MGALTRCAALAALLFAHPMPGVAQPSAVDRWRAFIAEASLRYGIPIAWIERVMRAESGGKTSLDGRPVVSRAGAMGLMQLMPATWAIMREQLRLGPDPHDPHDNIIAGTAYLRLLYDRFGYPGLFAAYNAGPARYADYLAGRATLPGETRTYLLTVAGRNPDPITGGFSPPSPPPSLFMLRKRDGTSDAKTGQVTVAPSPEPAPGADLFAIDRQR